MGTPQLGPAFFEENDMPYNEEDDRRETVINHISNLYPPDSDGRTAEIGKQDLLNALAAEWRSLPIDVLEHMAAAQIERDRRA